MKTKQVAGCWIASESDGKIPLVGLGKTEEEAINDLERVREAKRTRRRRKWRSLSSFVEESPAAETAED